MSAILKETPPLTDAELDEMRCAWGSSVASIECSCEPCRAVLEIRKHRENADRIAERLVFAFRIYNGFKLGHRGPDGCIIDVLELVAPDVVREIREGLDMVDIYTKRWSDDT